MKFKYDDGGRGESGRKGKAGDCVVRAFSIALGGGSENYNRIYKMAAELEKEACGVQSARNGVTKKNTLKLAKMLGFRKISLPGVKPTFAEAYQRFGNCVASTTKHVAALKGGALYDLSDIRFYFWKDQSGKIEKRERKAMTVWTPPEARFVLK